MLKSASAASPLHVRDTYVYAECTVRGKAGLKTMDPIWKGFLQDGSHSTLEISFLKTDFIITHQITALCENEFVS
jgi:hypothetical protein